MERLESFFENGPSGPGIFWCASRIRKPDQISWDSYMRWYEAEIIPLCLALEGSPLCFRAAAADYGNERPCVFVAAYSEAKALASFDASYLHHDGGKLLPGVDSVFDVVDFDCRWFTVLDVTEHVKKPLSEVKSFMTVGWDIKGDIEESVLDSWWKTHHAEHLARVPGFIRSTRFHAQQSWWSAGNGASLPCPDFFEIMEFETPDVDVMTIVGHANSSEEGLEIQDAIMEACHFEFASYRMERTWGEGVMYEKK